MRNLAAFAFGLAVLAALAALASGLGHRFGLWDYRFGFELLRGAAWTGVAGALGCAATAVWAVRTRSLGALLGALLGLAVGGAAFGLPWAMIERAEGAPPIHDITTDTVNPPQFVALAAARRASPDGIAYGGAAVAALQRRAYPDIIPLAVGAHPPAVFERCLEAARGLGWKIVSANPAALRIEATDTTPFFGFKDDIGKPGGPALGLARGPGRPGHQRAPHPRLLPRTGSARLTRRAARGTLSAGARVPAREGGRDWVQQAGSRSPPPRCSRSAPGSTTGWSRTAIRRARATRTSTFSSSAAPTSCRSSWRRCGAMPPTRRRCSRR
jgi:hypothetical protein